MGKDFQTALELLGIGMITVVSILLLVVLSANVLIKLVNKFGPEPAIAAKKNTKLRSKNIDSKKLVVLAAVVDHITQGKGVIKDIKQAN